MLVDFNRINFLITIDFNRGDLNAIERIAYELCEDQSADQVLYFEARYSPHLLSNTAKHYSNLNPLPLDDPNAVTPRDVVLAVNRGFEKACSRFDIQASSILCIITGMPGWGSEVVDLANELKSVANVVGIDIAGNEGAFSEEDEHAFQRAKELGIHRTVHAGEMGPAVNVKNAVQKLHAERIGHGYHVINDKNIYDMCKARRIHFEACPYSSYLSGSVKKSQKHPILTFAEDDVNFSINKDDATVTQSTLSDEYRLLCSHGLNEVHLTRAVSDFDFKSTNRPTDYCLFAFLYK